MTDDQTPQWDVLCAFPGRVLRIGPIDFRHQAEAMTWAFTDMRHSTAGAAEGEYTIVEHDPTADGERLPYGLPTDADALAEMIAAEPGPAPFPDLFSRLHGEHGHESASKIWRAACDALGAVEAEREREQIAAHERRTRLAPLIGQIERTVASLAGIYTRPVVERGAELLADLYDAGARRGVDPRQWGYVTNLPSACVELVAAEIRKSREPLTADQGRELADQVAEALKGRGFPYRRGAPWSVACLHPVPGKRYGLMVTITQADGWSLAYDRPGVQPVAMIDATFDQAGATAVADAMVEIMRGERPLPRALNP